MNDDEKKEKKKTGFAVMSPEKQREISKMGGKAAHAQGTAFKFDEETAERAGRIGGEKISRDRAHMAKIGRKGAAARVEKAKKRRSEAMRDDG